ncbi:MAG: resolvase, partial [Bacteroidota bacterium]|nr:resolvase [Bacteroidota bacterium]
SLQSKKLSGVKLGRPKGPGKSKLDVYRIEIEALLNNGSTQKFIANRYQVTEPTLCNWMKKNKIKRNALLN